MTVFILRLPTPLILKKKKVLLSKFEKKILIHIFDDTITRPPTDPMSIGAVFTHGIVYIIIF